MTDRERAELDAYERALDALRPLRTKSNRVANLYTAVHVAAIEHVNEIVERKTDQTDHER